MNLEFPKSIFQNFENEFELFKKQSPNSLMMKLYQSKNLKAKYVFDKVGFETISAYNGKLSNGPTFVKYTDQSYYYGTVVNGVKQGEGYHLYANGFMFQGIYKDDLKFSGKVIDYKDGKDIYVGGWGNDNYQGDGYLRNPFKNTIYKGNFENGLFEREGKLTYEDGSFYQGNFSKGLRNGLGKLSMPEYVYEGEFKNGNPHGKGKIQFTNGYIYEGAFLFLQISGNGKLTNQNYLIDGVFNNGSVMTASMISQK